MPELSPELQRQLFLKDAQSALSARCGVQVTHEAAKHLVDAGCLQHVGNGAWNLDVNHASLLYAGPEVAALVPFATLQGMRTPAAAAEILRRQRVCLESAPLVTGSILNTSSGDGLGFDASELAQLDAFVQRHNDSSLESRVTAAQAFEFGRRGPGSDEPPQAA